MLKQKKIDFINANKRVISLYYRIVIVLFVISGLIVNFLTEDTAVKDILIMYTTMSNILVGTFFLFYVLLQMSSKSLALMESQTIIFIKSIVTFGIAVTFFIFLFGITPGSIIAGDYLWLGTYWNIVLHYIIPPMVIFDWIIFDRKKSYKKWYPFVFISLPFSYLIFALVRAEFGSILREGTPAESRYPYPFIDIDLLGVGLVVLIVIGITAICLGLGYLMYYIDHLSKKDGIWYFKNKIIKDKNNY